MGHKGDDIHSMRANSQVVTEGDRPTGSTIRYVQAIATDMIELSASR